MDDDQRAELRKRLAVEMVNAGEFEGLTPDQVRSALDDAVYDATSGCAFCGGGGCGFCNAEDPNWDDPD